MIEVLAGLSGDAWAILGALVGVSGGLGFALGYVVGRTHEPRRRRRASAPRPDGRRFPLLCQVQRQHAPEPAPNYPTGWACRWCGAAVNAQGVPPAQDAAQAITDQWRQSLRRQP